MGGNATPPPVKWATLPEPTRARPVPFCRHCLAVVPGDLAPGLGGRGALPVVGQLGRDHLMQQTDVDAGPAPDRVGQIVLTDDRAVLVDSVDGWHRPNL